MRADLNRCKMANHRTLLVLVKVRNNLALRHALDSEKLLA